MIVLLSCVLYLLIGSLILCMGGIGRENRRFPLWVSILCFLTGMAILALFLMRKRKKQIELPQDQKRWGKEYLAAGALFLAQIFVCYNTYFYTGWDCAIVLSAAENIAKGWDFSGNYAYFSQYPNNLFLSHLFGCIKHIVKEIGLTEKSHGMLALIFVQCFLNSMTGLLLFRVLLILRGRKTAWFGYLFYLVLVGTSPWLLIPYSDSMELIFPILLLYLWVKEQKASPKIRLFLWLAIGFLAAVGYHLKPLAVVIVIAIYLTEFLRLSDDRTGREKVLKVAGCAAGILCFFLVFMGMEQRYYYRYDGIDREGALGPAHYLMMGLNEESSGGNSPEDALFSYSFATAEERRMENLKMAGQRLAELGPAGYLRLIAAKTIINFEDGTFGWPDVNQEYFFQMIPEEKIPYVSAALRSVLYGQGIANMVFFLMKQCFWLTMLFLIGMGFMAFRKDKICAGCCLALTGLFLFCTLFEAGGRYQYTYIPIYCVLAAVSLGEIRNSLKGKKEEKLAVHHKGKSDGLLRGKKKNKIFL